MNKLISELYDKTDAQDKIINGQALEIARLKSIIEKWELGVFSNDEELQQRIDKAIELLKKYEHTNVEEYSKIIEFYKKLCEILGDKENDK